MTESSHNGDRWCENPDLSYIANPRPNAREVLQRMKRYPRFYQAVWKACAAIPKGEVRTYGWIARQIGKPKAARAVGGALGSNPVPLIIPCHRVISSAGGLGGYLFGTAVKARLLALERMTPSLVGNRVYLIGKTGKAWIVEPGREKCQRLGEADLGEECVTSPAFQPGRMYLRGHDNLFCIGSK